MKEKRHTQIVLDPKASARRFLYCLITGLILVLLNLSFSGITMAQVKPGDFFIVNSKVKVYPVTDFSKSVAGNKASFLFAVADQKFTVIDVSEIGIIQIQFWKFSDGVVEESLTQSDITDTKTGNNKIFVDRDVNGKIFTIDLKDLNEKCMPYLGHKTSFTFGVMSLPLKIRFGTETTRRMLVEEKLNIGLTPGLKFQLKGRKEQSITFLTNIGISNVSTKLETFKAGYSPSSDNEPALSGALGLIYQHEKFQAGILSGKDWLLSYGADNWKYQGKRWIGIGIGFPFFGQGEDAETNPGENK